MKATIRIIMGAGLLAWCGCRESPRVELPLPEPPKAPSTIPGLAGKEIEKPVVHVAPVPTEPFEEGYKAGFELGSTQAVPQAKIPEAAEVEAIADRQFGADMEHRDRWHRGFVEGYLDGFRKIVTGQK
jgi:hypothetical protein